MNIKKIFETVKDTYISLQELQSGNRIQPALYRKLMGIRRRIYTPLCKLNAEIIKSDEPIPFDQLDRSAFTPLRPGVNWGRKYDCAWLRITGRLPAGREDAVVLLGIRGESLVYSSAGEILDSVSTVWMIGDLPHSGGKYRAVRCPCPPGGEIELFVDTAYNGFLLYDFGSARYHGAFAAVCDRDAYTYYYDFLTLTLLAAATDDKALAGELRRALNRSYTQCFTKGDGQAAQAMLAPLLNAASQSPFTYSAVGHGHLDMAWLWPLRETRRKAARTYIKALNNMEAYSNYIYGTSQPQQLLWMKQEHPVLYRRIRQAVADGRMELQGAFWVECDTNLPGGESLVRQALLGRRFLSREFGEKADSIRLCWLPDAFGYSGNLPQILKKSGMDWFSTIKLAWNKVNRFPYRSFRWQGIDGSTVLVHMPPEGDYNSRGAADGLLKGIRQYPEKELNAALLVYGSGDGGGGPGEVHLEVTGREHNLRGLPKVEYATADSFFRRLEQMDIPHTHVGELYLETHQGTYTTQGKIKYYNRLLERKLHNAEALAVCTGSDCRSVLEPHWRDLLLNQFHDIIPGSSITRVNREAEETYRGIDEALESYISGLMAGLRQDGGGPAAINLTSFARGEYLKVNQEWYRAEVEPYAAAALRPTGDFPEPRFTGDTLTNGLITLRFDDAGTIVSLVDAEGREHSGGGLNRLVLHRDPYQFPFDAWDIDQKYHKKAGRRLKASAAKSYSDGPTAVREHTYRYPGLIIVQKVILEDGSDIVRFDTKVKWHKKHRMLRAEFYPAHYDDSVRCEIQFGHIIRSTTEDDPVQAAQFEICAHKWVATRNGQAGFALLNDCKYGHRAKNGSISLNLLRAPSFPDKTADRGEHHFCYAICPFAEDDLVKVVREAYRLNNPLLPLLPGQGILMESLAHTDNPAVVLETIKPAEEGGGVVLRLYECLGAPAYTALYTRLPHKHAFDVDLLERKLAPADLARLEFGPFEIKTILLEEG